jgi:hypothetical protein
MLIKGDLTGVEGHTQPNPLRVRVRAVMPMQRGSQCVRQGFREHALGDLRTHQDENPVAAVLVITMSPRDSRPTERLAHGTVQAIPDGHLIPVRATPVPEPLNVNCNDRPVNGQASTRHMPSRKDQAKPRLH